MTLSNYDKVAMVKVAVAKTLPSWGTSLVFGSFIMGGGFLVDAIVPYDMFTTREIVIGSITYVFGSIYMLEMCRRSVLTD